MAVVSLGNIVKYNGEYYPAHTAIIIDESDVASFVKLGATILSNDMVDGADKKEYEPPVASDIATDVVKMKLPELRKYAKEHGIKITDKKATREDIINTIISSIK